MAWEQRVVREAVHSQAGSECSNHRGGGRRGRTWLHWPPAAMKPLPTARLVGVKLSFCISADCAHQAHGRC